ncbi:hypothetical protein KY328_04250 [Candidatus Woesearchaeota archaeon]|nr:hypothetical protein [Candidatus Woesearchaeota archaeon]
MGVFDFLKKKKEEFPSFQEPTIPGEHDIGLPPERPAELPGRPMEMPSMTPTPSFERREEGTLINKDLEVISAKLDALKATLEAINQRLTNIERIAAGEEKHERFF